MMAFGLNPFGSREIGRQAFVSKLAAFPMDDFFY